MKGPLTISDLIKKIRQKDFVLSYEEAIDLYYLGLSVDYHWQYFLGHPEKTVLLWVIINNFDLMITVKQ